MRRRAGPSGPPDTTSSQYSAIVEAGTIRSAASVVTTRISLAGSERSTTR
ncbi:hypothetical protein [Thermocatellispora tengchongensis]